MTPEARERLAAVIERVSGRAASLERIGADQDAGDLRSLLSRLEEVEAGLAKAVEIVTDVIAWDMARGYPVPYRVRDPLHSFLTAEQNREARSLLNPTTKP